MGKGHNRPKAACLSLFVCVCVCVLTMIAQMITAKHRTCNRARTDLLSVRIVKKNNWRGLANMGRGAAGTEWGRGGAVEWALPPTLSTEKFLTFCLKIVHFGVYSDKNSQFSTLSYTFINICHCWGVMPDPPGVLQEALTGGGLII